MAMKVLWFVLCLAYCIQLSAFQKKSNVADTLLNKTLNQVVVTGTGTHNRAKDAVVPVRVITSEELRANHITSLEDALVQLMPNITRMTNGMGTTLSLNGLEEDYMLILVDGFRLTGDDRYTRINMSNIKRIEVLSGSASSLYGSDAIGGVVNIITSSSGSTRGYEVPRIEISNTSHVSSKGRFHENFSADIVRNGFSSQTSYQRQQSDNWQVNDHELVFDKLLPTGRIMGQAYQSNLFNQRFSYSFKNGLKIYVRGSFYDYHTNRPQMAKYYKGSTKKNQTTGTQDTLYTLQPAYTYDLHRSDCLYGIGAHWRLNPITYLEADFYSDNLNSERDSFQTQLPGGKLLTKRQHYYDSTVKGIFHLGHNNKLSAGLEHVHDTYESYNFPFHTMYTFSLFAQDELRICSRLQGVLGLRYIANQRFGSYATPSFQFMYSPGPLRLRFAYNTGYRTPTLLQMFYENDETKTITLGNSKLSPEKSNFFQIHTEYNNTWMSISASLHYNRIRDMINYRTLTDIEVATLGLDSIYPSATKFQQRDNINKAEVKGIHLGAEFYLPSNLRLGGSYAYNHTRAISYVLDKSTQEYVKNIEDIDRSVRHNASAHASWHKGWHNYVLDINLLGHFQGRRWSTSYGWAPSFSQVDFNTTHTWHCEEVDLEPAIGVQNIFNKRDTRPWCSNFSTLHPGRCFYVSFAIKYKK